MNFRLLFYKVGRLHLVNFLGALVELTLDLLDLLFDVLQLPLLVFEPDCILEDISL